MEKRAMARLIICVGILVLLSGHGSWAGQSVTAKDTSALWARADRCNRQAIAKFPDHTSEAFAQREQYVRHCNVAARTPARTPLASSPQ